MDVVLSRIHYRPEVIDHIIEDFNAFVHETPLGTFQEDYNHIIKPEDKFWKEPEDKVPDLSDPRYWDELNMICTRMTTEKLEEGLEELKKRSEDIYENFDHVKRIAEGEDPEGELDRWLRDLPCRLYILYNTVTRILWKKNREKYTRLAADAY